MKRYQTFKSHTYHLTAISVFLLLISCSLPAHNKIYSGPTLSKEQVVFLVEGSGCSISSIDGKNLRRSSWDGTMKIELLPGDHTITAGYYESVPDGYYRSTEDRTFKFKAWAGHTYQAHGVRYTVPIETPLGGRNHYGRWRFEIYDITDKNNSFLVPITNEEELKKLVEEKKHIEEEKQAQAEKAQKPVVKIVMDPRSSQRLDESQKRITNSIGMEMVLIPSGSFMMGSLTDEPQRENDETQHRVTISQPYYLQTTEVTQGQWKAIMGNNPSHFKNCGDDCPVENVYWSDVQQFIQKLNQKESTSKYRLPTEAEWEYAARAGTTTRFYSGDNVDDLSRAGWYKDNSGSKTHPVRQKISNAWGLYDMHGNVYEWCQDWYGSYPRGSVTDPTGPSSGQHIILRGGSWGTAARYVRAADRGRCGPQDRHSHFGFRVARDF